MRALCVALTVIVASVTHRAHMHERTLPPRLAGYVADVVELTMAEQRRLLDNAPVAKLLDSRSRDEVAVFAAIWIDAPLRRYLESVQDIEQFERGAGFEVTKRISPIPRHEDFARLQLPQEDVEDLRHCRIGDCSVKLDERAIARFRHDVDWQATDVQDEADSAMRQFAWEYATRYVEGGDQRLGVYRDGPQPIGVAEQFRDLVAQVPDLTSCVPALRRHLLEYPRHAVPEATSFLYWQRLAFGLRPTIRISHVLMCQGPSDAVVVSKMLYASHYFRAGLEFRALLPDATRGPGFWLVMVNRSRVDGMRGVSGFFVRRRVRVEVVARAVSALQATRRKLEEAGSQ